MASPATVAFPRSGSKTESYVDNKRKEDVRQSNILSARTVADTVRTSLGPRGMDKMISTSSGDVIITNDGATILNKMEVLQPAAKMLVELSKSQDSAAGDGTTTVVVIAGALLRQCLSLLSHGIHPTVISDSLHKAALKAVDVLTAMAVPVELSDRESLIKSASTSLNSKVVSQYSSLLAPLAVDSVLSVVDPAKPDIVDLRDIKIVKKLGGTVDDTELALSKFTLYWLSNLNNQTRPPKNMATNSAPLNNSSTQNKSSSSPSPSSSLSIQSKEEVEKVFNRFDTNGDGKISVTELGAVFSSLGSSFSDEDELRRIMDELDSDHDGFISLTEFAAFCSSSSAEDGGVSELREAFKLYDQDQNGLISASELHLVLNRLGMNCSVEDCHRMIRSVDSDGDGNVNFEEFQKMMTTANANNSNASPL